MKKILWTFILTLSLVSVSNATITCEGVTSLGASIKIKIEENDTANLLVINEDGSKELELDFIDLLHSWDGHISGLITARGLSVKYQNHFGCIRMVEITTMVSSGIIDTISIPTCSGGSTPDDICM